MVDFTLVKVQMSRSEGGFAVCSLGLTQDLQGAATGRLAYLPPSPPGPPNPPPAPPSPPSPPPAAKY